MLRNGSSKTFVLVILSINTKQMLPSRLFSVVCVKCVKVKCEPLPSTELVHATGYVT